MRYEQTKPKQFQPSPFKKGKIKCHLCKEVTDWHCRITEDEGLAYCRYTPNESGKKDSRGRFEHILKKDSARNLITNTKPMETVDTENAKADADRLNEVYSALLERLELNEVHSDKLLYERKLSDVTIAKNLYATAPTKNEADRIAQELSESFDLEGVPGFYYTNNSWCLEISCCGFYVPYRDEQGRINGLQFRKDIDGKPKYLWLSSNGKEKGTSSGAPLHFVNPDLVRKDKIVFITEGALKADIIGEKGEIGIVAMAGVNGVSHQKLVDSIFNVFPELEKIIVAFDADYKENEAVKNAMLSLLNVLKDKSNAVFVADWDISFGKGFDDVLNNDEISSLTDVVKFIPAQDFRKMLTSENIEQVESLQNQKTEETAENQETQSAVMTNEQQEMNTVLDEEYITEDSIDTFGATWGDFSRIRFNEPERVMFGLCRGNIGQLVASTNIGKTTLMLNLTISACSDQHFEPLLNEQTVGKRILYIDGEATKAELQADINKMLESCSPAQRLLLNDRLCLICDEELNDEPLDLVNMAHREKIEEIALRFKPDLIVVDTLSALANMEDENDNAKVKKEIIQPLKTLAKRTNSAVLILHHTGKYSEGSPQATDAYKGRGASAFGALSRVVLNLKESKTGKITLSCSKVKGENFQDVVMVLDQNSRWFKLTNETAIQTLSKADLVYWKVVNFVLDAKKPVKKSEIEKGLPEIHEKSITRKLGDALKNGDLIQPSYAYYSAPDYKGDIPNSYVENCRIISNAVIYAPNKGLGLKK